MAKEIEMQIRFISRKDRDVLRKEQKIAMGEYEENNDCTVTIKSCESKHYPSPGPGLPDYWIETTVLEVFDIISPSVH